jgi:hypothetical protein
MHVKSLWSAYSKRDAYQLHAHIRKLEVRGLIIVCHVSGSDTKQIFLETVHGKVPISRDVNMNKRT